MMVQICFIGAAAWSNKDVGFLGLFHCEKAVFVFSLLFCSILELILQYLRFLKMCECALRLTGDPRIKRNAASNCISLQQKILKNMKKKDNHCLESGKFVSSLCNLNNSVGKYIVQLPEVVPFPITPAHESLVGFG